MTEGTTPEDRGAANLWRKARVAVSPSRSLKAYAGEQNGRPLRILCIDGGGARGIGVLVMLEALQAACGQPIHELFDLICGTSIGAAIATGLSHGISIADMYEVLAHMTYKSDKEINGGKPMFA